MQHSLRVELEFHYVWKFFLAMKYVWKQFIAWHNCSSLVHVHGGMEFEFMAVNKLHCMALEL